MSNFKRMLLAFLISASAATVSVLGLHLPPSFLTASSEEIINTAPQIIQSQIPQDNPDQNSSNNSEGEQSRECGKIFWGVWYIEEPKWDQEETRWSCCRYVDGEPDCADPPENSVPYTQLVNQNGADV